MKKKNIYILLIILLNSFFYYTYANDLSIKTNIDWWEFDKVIEVNLISNNKNAKIFYYIDWEWRIDNQIEYKTPIIIKKDTILNYYAFLDARNSTLIEEKKYKFNYPENFNISYKDNKINIINKNWTTINIWYWKIEADNINYEIYKNTFIKNNNKYILDYKAKEQEKIIFISPDNKVKIQYKIPKQNIIVKEIKKIEINEKTKLTNYTDTINPKNTEINKDNNKIIVNQINSFNSKNETKNIEKNNFDINKNLKSSIIDTNNDKNNIKFIYVIVLVFLLWIIYKIILILDKKWIIKLK